MSASVSNASVSLTRSTAFLSTTVGKKVVMAVTGVILFAFVIGHMIGNLQIYLGAEAMDHYAVFLRELLHGAGLWIARVVLLTSVGLHIWAATAVTLGSWAARPVRYRRVRHVESTYASRTMRWGGPILAAFVVYHIMHLTLGSAGLPFEEGRVYRNVVAGFRLPLVSLFYVVAQIALGLHLYHGGWSMLQSLGLSHARWNRLRFAVSLAVTLLVVIGNVSIPVAVLAGWVK